MLLFMGFLITFVISTVKAKFINLLGTFSGKNHLGYSIKLLD